MDRLKRFVAQRYLLAPVICFAVGMVLHFKGVKLTDEGKNSLQQFVAALFDLLALISGQSAARFSLSQKKQETIKKTVDINAKVANPLVPTGQQLPVTVEEVAKAEEWKKQ